MNAREESYSSVSSALTRFVSGAFLRAGLVSSSEAKGSSSSFFLFNFGFDFVGGGGFKSCSSVLTAPGSGPDSFPSSALTVAEGADGPDAAVLDLKNSSLRA